MDEDRLLKDLQNELWEGHKKKMEELGNRHEEIKKEIAEVQRKIDELLYPLKSEDAANSSS